MWHTRFQCGPRPEYLSCVGKLFFETRYGFRRMFLHCGRMCPPPAWPGYRDPPLPRASPALPSHPPRIAMPRVASHRVKLPLQSYHATSSTQLTHIRSVPFAVHFSILQGGTHLPHPLLNCLPARNEHPLPAPRSIDPTLPTLPGCNLLFPP